MSLPQPLVDNKTLNLQLPLPDAINSLSADVLRLISALNIIDTNLHNLLTTTSAHADDLSTIQSQLDQLQQQTADLQLQATELTTAVGQINTILLTKADTSAVDPAGTALALSIALG